jgi:hypothetical protein
VARVARDLLGGNKYLRDSFDFVQRLANSLPSPVMVNVFVKAEAAVDEWIHTLAISLEDIDRLSLRPLKWLRFVTFTVVGARGHLFDAPDGNLVDYENVSLANIAENTNYYFAPEGDTPPLNPSSTDKALRDKELPLGRSTGIK